MASYYKPLSFFLVSFYLLFLIESTKKPGITLDLIHRDSPLSPSYNPSNTRFERLRSAFERSFSRKLYLKSASIGTTSSRKGFQAPITSNGGEYLMKIAIGTPPFDVLAIADTGSDLTWTQCQPCTQCYKQKAPLFDPKNTSTYSGVSCKSPSCKAVTASSCDSKNVCEYHYSYGDSSYTIGELATETFTFDDSVRFPKVVFGCGHNNEGTFSSAGSGLIGLGGGPLSIVKQLGKSIGGKFSYCLTLLSSNDTSTISFGTNAIVTGADVVSTPLVKKEPDTFYYLTLEGVSVGTTRVDYKSDDFESIDEGNIIIDSGTTLTFLPSDLYNGLEPAIVEAVTGTRTNDTKQSFNVCYEKSSDFSAPPVVVHFTGGDVVLTQESTFLEVDPGFLCFTFVPSDDLAIFGNLHQMNFKIGYDSVNGKVSFVKTDCSSPQ